MSPSSRGRGLKYFDNRYWFLRFLVALFTRAWIEILVDGQTYNDVKSPSSRGRGLKFENIYIKRFRLCVALFTRAWIEIPVVILSPLLYYVALFTRAWIEIRLWVLALHRLLVALFTRAWIEISPSFLWALTWKSPSSRGRGLKSVPKKLTNIMEQVALFTRAWIEMPPHFAICNRLCVALFTRAWIEMSRLLITW